jgi:hypothetical protein
MELAVPAAKARGGEDAAPGFADGRRADEPGGLVRRKAEEDLLYELVHQDRRKAGEDLLHQDSRLRRRQLGFWWGIGEWKSGECECSSATATWFGSASLVGSGNSESTLQTYFRYCSVLAE